MRWLLWHYDPAENVLLVSFEHYNYNYYSRRAFVELLHSNNSVYICMNVLNASVGSYSVNEWTSAYKERR